MKISNKLLFITGIVLAVLVFSLVLGSRIFLNSITESVKEGEVNYSESTKAYSEFTNFTNLDISGEWDITIKYGMVFDINIDARRGTIEPYEIKKTGNTLFLTENPQSEINRKLTAVITMPELKGFNSTGGVKLDLNGFIEPDLILNFKGGAWASAENCQFDNLHLNSAGAINLEFGKIKIVNVDVQLKGAGNLIFHMDGGILSGNASGAVNIEYSGEARQEIQSAGLANIERRK
jgi:Putative auto-transporter adhesin, head GIN domain